MLRLAVFTGLLAAALTAQNAGNSLDPAIFKAPPAEYRGHAMWNFNLAALNENAVVAGIQEMAKLNYGGFFIEVGGRPQPGQGVAFLSSEYFRFYKLAMEEAKKQGLEVILYDDYAFPTGTVGGQMLAQFPQLVAKNLNMAEKDVTGPANVDLAIPQGIYIGSVMMNRDTFDLADVSDRRNGDRLVCPVPTGQWKVMAFYLTSGQARVVDYLDESAMSEFIKMTYQKYQDNLGSYFGNLIKQTFYDEPSMHHADRLWTAGFNAEFQKKYGYSPMKYYPALWYDIGPQTSAARNALFGFRGDLFATRFIKRLNDWCADHHLIFGGHLDQEEPINPTPLNGDLLKVFQYQSAPTVDDIWWYGRSNPS
jgi:hypothetical protein